MRYAMATAVWALGSFMLSATVSGADATSAGTNVLHIDACALLLPSEISQVIGLPVDAGSREDDGLVSNGSYSSVCLWKVKSEKPTTPNPGMPLSGQSFVILNAMQWPAGSGLAHTFLERFRTAAEAGEIPAKPSPRNFGDEALWWGDGLAVRKYDVSFGLSVFIPERKAKSPGAFEEQLAPQVLRRLEQREQQMRR